MELRFGDWLDTLPLLATADAVLGVTALGYALARRRGFASTISWVLAIVALPFIGPLAYFLLANPVIKRTRRLKHLAARRQREALTACDAGALQALAELPPIERTTLELASRVTGMAPTAGNRLEILTANRYAFERIGDAIRAARRQIWAEYYIVSGDETGRRFLELLAERARAGVEVRLLYDSVGSAGIDSDRVRDLIDAGGKVEEFLPVNPLRRRWAVHLRNHRKILVVDGEVGFTGGMNVGDVYSGASRRRRIRPWRDTHLMLRGPAVRDLAEIFAEDWCFASGEERLDLPPAPACEARGSIVAAVPSGPDQELNATGLLYFSGVAGAVSRCWITSPYFVPDEPTLRALTAAALRGVDVRVLVPRNSDVLLLPPAMRSYYPQLVRAGVRVYEYLPTMLHAKTMVVDGAWAFIGSANLDMRSFRLNFEASLLVHDPAFAAVMEDGFERDLKDAEEITPERMARKGLPAKLAEGAAQMLSPLL